MESREADRYTTKVDASYLLGKRKAAPAVASMSADEDEDEDDMKWACVSIMRLVKKASFPRAPLAFVPCVALACFGGVQYACLPNTSCAAPCRNSLTRWFTSVVRKRRR